MKAEKTVKKAIKPDVIPRQMIRISQFSGSFEKEGCSAEESSESLGNPFLPEYFSLLGSTEEIVLEKIPKKCTDLSECLNEHS